MQDQLEEVNIEAGPGVFRHYKGYRLDPWICLAEFVDNSLGSFTNNETKKYRNKFKKRDQQLKVKIYRDISNRTIKIEDDAGGIPDKDLPRALKIGDRPPDTSSYNEFGVGMKMAAFWFCSKWTITTKAYGETDVKQIIFDVDEIEKHQLTRLPVMRIGKESESVAYTHIELLDIYDEHWPSGPKTLEKIKRHLSSIYRRVTEKNIMKLTYFDGEKEQNLIYKSPKILLKKYVDANENKDTPEEEWKVNIDFKIGNRQISGWVGILAESSGPNAGFTLLRRNRVIEGQDRSWKPDKKESDKNWFWSGNTAPRARLFGELDFKGFEVTNNKSQIGWGKEEEDVKEKFLVYLKETIQYKTSKRSESNFTRFWIQLLNHTNKKDKEEAPFSEFYPLAKQEVQSSIQHETKDAFVPIQIDQDKVIKSKEQYESAELKYDTQEIPLNVNNEHWMVKIIPVEIGGGNSFFDLVSYETDQYPKLLEVKWDITHPFSAIANLDTYDGYIANAKGIFAIISGICISEIHVEYELALEETDNHDSNIPSIVSPDYFRQIVNSVLDTFKHQ